MTVRSDNEHWPLKYIEWYLWVYFAGIAQSPIPYGIRSGGADSRYTRAVSCSIVPNMLIVSATLIEFANSIRSTSDTR